MRVMVMAMMDVRWHLRITLRGRSFRVKVVFLMHPIRFSHACLETPTIMYRRSRGRAGKLRLSIPRNRQWAPRKWR